MISVYGQYGPLHWRHNERDGVSNHQPHDRLLDHLFRRRSKKISKLRVTGLCEGNSPLTGEFPAERASNAENVSIWWRHHTVEHDILMTNSETTSGALSPRQVTPTPTGARSSNELQRLDKMIECQDSSPSNGYPLTCVIFIIPLSSCGLTVCHHMRCLCRHHPLQPRRQPHLVHPADAVPLCHHRCLHRRPYCQGLPKTTSTVHQDTGV